MEQTKEKEIEELKKGCRVYFHTWNDEKLYCGKISKQDNKVHYCEGCGRELKGFLAGQKAEQERSIKLCNKCKPYQEGQNSQKDALELIEKDLKFCNCFLEQDNEEVKKRMVILFIKMLLELKQKIKGMK